mmetsp:Transcript_28075/g.43839  ORF Transcript_28075/g.43839 Transcript_28075/m.43839 type:complete len:80 (-) Transcript_28075:789-1028(-)
MIQLLGELHLSVNETKSKIETVQQEPLQEVQETKTKLESAQQETLWRCRRRKPSLRRYRWSISNCVKSSILDWMGCRDL